MNRFLVLLAVILLGCAGNSSTNQRIASLHEGMTRQELISLLGNPRTVTNQGALSVYDYAFPASQSAPATSYYVIVGKDDRVRSFGPN
jgi:outer membrane protein assembly factor BamE (lipoprotein component of BamABCDE complex)